MTKDSDELRARTPSRRLQEALRERFLGFGLCGLGFSSLTPFWFDANHIQRRTYNGQRSTMNFTFRRPTRSITPQASFPFARSIIVGYHDYGSRTTSDADPTEAVVASYAVRDEYSILRSKLEGLAGLVRDCGYRATIVIDDNALVDKAVARRSGEGWIGRNTLFLSNRFGPFVLIGSIVTDAEFDVEPPIVRRSCGTCFQCVEACPTGALDGHGGLDAERCLAWLLQKPGPFPHEFRTAAGRRIYGCDACLLSCPVGSPYRKRHGDQTASGHRETGTERDDPMQRYSLVDLLALGDTDLLDRCRHFYIPQRDPDHLRRNLLLALGNSGISLPRAQETLDRYLCSKNAILSEQANWSRDQLRTRQST